ncbi:hypothetical protein Scep_019463 [Stephania cephalantha]|uniref:Uncharacterized protein n=1 Tax=Stephania cephalantha TaxID=152367 RepID=A0AAP0IAT8_9MAGN
MTLNAVNAFTLTLDIGVNGSECPEHIIVHMAELRLLLSLLRRWWSRLVLVYLMTTIITMWEEETVVEVVSLIEVSGRINRVGRLISLIGLAVGDVFLADPSSLLTNVVILHGLESGKVDGGDDVGVRKMTPGFGCGVHVPNDDVGLVDTYLTHQCPIDVHVKKSDAVLTTAGRENDLVQDFVEKVRHKF